MLRCLMAEKTTSVQCICVLNMYQQPPFCAGIGQSNWHHKIISITKHSYVRLNATNTIVFIFVQGAQYALHRWRSFAE